MKGTIFVVLLVVIGVRVEVGALFEEKIKIIGADGVVKNRYQLYETNIEDFCESEPCRKYFRRANEEYDCGENEVYHKVNVTNHCGLGCPSGCYCKPGYVKLKKREPCVPVEETDDFNCKKNEILGCGKYDCQPYCDIGPDPLCYQNNFECRLSYNCFCKPGYIRLDGGECIKNEKCPYILLDDAVEEKEFKPKKPFSAVPFLEKTKIGGDL